jgi:Holliday junction resolvasome RuvABC ATP-dependent DNA helicase subunit
MYRSKKFIHYLDGYCNKSELTLEDCNRLTSNINKQFHRKYGPPPDVYLSFDATMADLSNPLGGILPPLHDLDYKPLTAPAPPQVPQVPHVEHICVKTKTVTIETDVKSLVDLLHIINAHEYDAETQYNIDLKSLHAIKEEMTLLNDMIGMETIKTAVMNQLLYFIQNLGSGDAGNGDFKHTVICGPPGTGKTEIAKLIGKMYSKVGILKNNVFKKVTRSDLIAGYLGQTAIKTQKVVTECIGGVLFIDEAYSLAAQDGNDSFSKECLDTLCEALSDHKTDLMVIIAGYEDDLNGTFFKVNRGLESRFIWKFRMDPYTADELMRIFEKKIADNGWQLNIDTPILRTWFTRNHKKFVHYGRDMEQLFTYAKIHHSRRIYGKPTDLRKKITIDDLTCAFDVFETNKKKEAVPDYLQNIYV